MGKCRNEKQVQPRLNSSLGCHLNRQRGTRNTMRLQVQILLSVASGGLAPPLVRAFTPHAAGAVMSTTTSSSLFRLHHNVLARSAATCASARVGDRLPNSNSITRVGAGRACRSSAWLGVSSRSVQKHRYVGHMAAGDGAVSGGGGRASAAVLQDADKRGSAEDAGARKQGQGGKLDLKPPKGTRDVFPEDMRLRNW